MYDLIIIGGGPAGVAAGVYAARKKIKALVIAENFGGQSVVSAGIENWIGAKSLSGFDFARNLEEHLRAQEDLEIMDGDRVVRIEKNGDHFIATTAQGKNLETKTIFVGSGSRRRTLGVPGEKEFNGKGVAYCATCDAPIFKNKVVAVVGGGNAGLESVRDLIPYASKIFLLNRSAELKGDPITQEKIRASEKVQIILNATTKEIYGQNSVTGIKYADAKSGEIKDLLVSGVFVEIGSMPNTDFLQGLVELNPFGEMVVDHKTQSSSLTGIWGAGDVTDVIYKQNNISAGDAIKAVLNINDYLHKKK